MLGLQIFNGLQTLSAEYTCSRQAGSSVVDYICGRSLPSTFQVCPDTLGSLSDHCVLACTLPLPSLMDPDHAVLDTATRIKYRWITGAMGCEEGASAESWTARTNTDEFADTIMGILSC